MRGNTEMSDLRVNWHPCSQMKDYEDFPPLIVNKANGCYIEMADGSRVIDAVSSWWCKSLGHNHPIIKQAVLKQVEKFEHVIFANTTHQVIIDLSNQLLSLFPWLGKAFYVGDGSCAVEVAMKMSLQIRAIAGEPERNQFIALKNGYHGETMAALSLSDVSLYRAPYSAFLFHPKFIEVPYVLNRENLLWSDASVIWRETEKQLEAYKGVATAIFFEPIVQGAGGMKIYSKDFLYRLVAWAKKNNIHVIADEIMTGMGRTGKMLACEHAKVEPDIVCLSKGLTSGWMPFSAVLTTNKIYDFFYDDYNTQKAFLHSHTYSGHAIGACAALATVKYICENELCLAAEKLEKKLLNYMSEIADFTGVLSNVRSIGAMVAADLIPEISQDRLGYQIFKQAVKLGALLRPLGNTLY